MKWSGPLSKPKRKIKKYSQKASYILEKSPISPTTKNCQLPNTLSNPKPKINTNLPLKKSSYFFKNKKLLYFGTDADQA